MRNICGIFLSLDQWFRSTCRIKIFLIFSSYSFLVQHSGTICEILLEGIMRKIYYFEFGPVIQEMSFIKIFYIYSSCSYFVLQSNHLCNFGRGHFEK